MKEKKNVKITNNVKDPKLWADFTTSFAADPKRGALALGLFLSKAASEQELDKIESYFIRGLCAGAGQSWEDLTGDKLPAFRARVTAIVLHADILGELAVDLDTPFDKEKFLANRFREMDEQSGLRGNDEMKATYMELEAEQARKRLAKKHDTDRDFPDGRLLPGYDEPVMLKDIINTEARFNNRKNFKT